MSNREVFRKNLVNMMNLTKVKQIDVAKYAQVSYQTVSAWICGRSYPRADAMERLCKFFGIKQSVLTEEQNSEKTQEDMLLSAFRALSDLGREKLMERAYELVILYPKRGNKNGET